MANKSKIAGTQTSAAGQGLEAKLSEALETLQSGQEAKAQELLQSLGAEASEAGDFVMARRVRTALISLGRKSTNASRVAPASEEMSIQVHLNRGEAKEALALAEQCLKKDAQRSGYHYLKSLALAKLGEDVAAAEAMKQAVALEPGLLYQFRLEKDFDGVRATAAFGELERV